MSGYPHILSGLGLFAVVLLLWTLVRHVRLKTRFANAGGYRSAPARDALDIDPPDNKAVYRPLNLKGGKVDLPEEVVDPVLVIRQACLAMDMVARRRQVDLLRPYHTALPSMVAPRGALLSFLKSLLQNALEATPTGGAVICSVRLMPRDIHFIISDSSGCPGRDGRRADNVRRWPGLENARLVAEALGARLGITENVDEGVVVELVFARKDIECAGGDVVIGPWSTRAGNDDCRPEETKGPDEPGSKKRTRRQKA